MTVIQWVIGIGAAVLSLLTAVLVYAMCGSRELVVSESTRREMEYSDGKKGHTW
jgi:hypothetical protein